MVTIKFLKYTAFVFIAVLLASCEYEVIEVYKPAPPNPNDTIYFQSQIAPIFVSSGCTACHTGGIAFDLTTENAYNSIVSNNLVVPFNPEQSDIYTYPHPQTGSHNSKYKSMSDVNLIYGWILQGALNN